MQICTQLIERERALIFPAEGFRRGVGLLRGRSHNLLRIVGKRVCMHFRLVARSQLATATDRPLICHGQVSCCSGVQICEHRYPRRRCQLAVTRI